MTARSGGPKDPFDLTGRVAIVTGGAGLLGLQHAEAILSVGGHVVLLDLPGASPESKAHQLALGRKSKAVGFETDITSLRELEGVRERIVDQFGRIDILINNAANNPKVETGGKAWTRLENFPLDVWEADLAVGLTGAFLCSRVFGTHMSAAGGGVILNIASDLALIGPDQRLYHRTGLPPDQQVVKPVTYSVVKTGLLGLTRYLATYWATQNVRVNAICPGGVFNGQPDDFVARLTSVIPMGRMAFPDEYRGAVIFLCSDASSYMTGAIIPVDGGRTSW